MAGPAGLTNPVEAAAYAVDAWQRSVLFLDVMRRRAVENEAHRAEVAPNVLDYKAELVLDGRRLERPVNYLLARILPPEGVEIDPRKRPFVIVDPRAGHGPGIGGFKADSEIGVAMKAGHAAYFIGFLPDPMPGQTILDITDAEATFLETVIARHPEAEGKPCVIGNCQAGWAVMLVAALRPELFGPIIIAGTPLVLLGWRATASIRCATRAGCSAARWLTALAGDLGAGIFDGAALVQNFENQNPANTLWSKQYNLWSKIDTEPERYLDFEKWWGGHITLNAEEMQWIVDELFVGNHLAAGDIRTPDGTAIDLRNIRSPIVVFCSQGDNITPPQQALDWILDLYDDVDEIRAYGQTIVYTIHDKVGHLGHLRLGRGGAEGARRVRLEHRPDRRAAARSLRGGADAEGRGGRQPRPRDRRMGDALRGAHARRHPRARRQRSRRRAPLRGCGTTVGDQPRALPVVPAALGQGGGDAADGGGDAPDEPASALLRDVRAAQPVPGLGRRCGRAGPGAPSAGPFRQSAACRAGAAVAADRRRAGGVAQGCRETVRGDVPRGLWRPGAAGGARRRHGLEPAAAQGEKSLLHRALVETRIAELRREMTDGGLREALVRALLYVGMTRDSMDERGFEAIRRVRSAHPRSRQMTLEDFKMLVRQQFFMLLIDQEAALKAIPGLMPDSAEERRAAFETLREVLAASGALNDAATKRLGEVATLFGLDTEPVTLVPRGAGTGRKAS